MSGNNIARLKELRDILKADMNKLKDINDKINEMRNNHQQIIKNYNDYYSLINKGKNNVNEITKQEYYENLFLYFGFFFFFGCVIYVISKRIPINKIIIFIFELIYKLFGFVIK